MGDNVDKCKNACSDLNCSDDCSSDGCFRMAEANCKEAPDACFCCPCKYAGYGTQHCLICFAEVTRGDRPQSASDIRRDMQMREDDRICGDNHCGGCLCCPLFISAAALGLFGCIMTWFSAVTCCMVACCCKCCESCKKNSVSP